MEPAHHEKAVLPGIAGENRVVGGAIGDGLDHRSSIEGRSGRGVSQLLIWSRRCRRDTTLYGFGEGLEDRTRFSNEAVFYSKGGPDMERLGVDVNEGLAIRVDQVWVVVDRVA
jgi:hypothetical protein